MPFQKNLNKVTPYLLYLLLLCFSLPTLSKSAESGVRKVLDTLLVSRQHPLLQQGDFSRETKELINLYQINANHLIWLGEGRSEKNLNDVLDVLMNAGSDGLNPLNYDAERLRHFIQDQTSLRQMDYQRLATYDVAISISVLRFVHDLSIGRIDPRSINYPAKFGSKPAINTPVILKKLLDQQRITELPQIAAPTAMQYTALKQALAEYRQLAENPPPPKLIFSKPLHPGESDPQLPKLRERLHEMGELTLNEIDAAGEMEALYDTATTDAVIRLQKKQGLNADGLIGKQTLTLFNQTPAEKIALIELAMERLRWLPPKPSGPYIVVNIPAFQLWAFNSPDDENALNMKVVVGKALENQTPVLWEEMQYLEFMPYWNIPSSIMNKEILPKIQAGQNFLSHQKIELIDRYVAEEMEDPQDVLGGIKHGRFRGRQQPGGKNPLGKVKFIFPNSADVYLHDTPFRSAFTRDRRDLSHGCVRVEEAEKLAKFVLDNQQGWDSNTIAQAMSATKTQRVSLKKPIPVVFFYATAYAGQDKKLRFYPDIYGYDQQLQTELNKSSNKLKLSGKNMVNG